MILVDTSVMIDFLRDIGNEQTAKFNKALVTGLPFGINCLIYQELLQGCKSERDYRRLKEYLDSQRFYHLRYGRGSYADAARIYFALKKAGRTLRSTIDCLIAETAIENDLFLLHNDSNFDLISQVTPLKIY